MNLNNVARFLVPLIIASLLIYCCITLLTTPASAVWRHYLALALFIPLPVLYFIHKRIAVIATGAYLLLASINVLAMTPFISTGGIQIGSIQTPPIQYTSLVLLTLHYFLNRDVFSAIFQPQEKKEQQEAADDSE